MRGNNDHKRRGAVITGVALITILVMEVVLRVAGFYKTYTEKMDGVYISYYDKRMPTWYHEYRPYDSILDVKPEYTYRTRTNGYGYRDAEFDTMHDDHRIKAIVLGDSFVQGLGTPMDSTWPHLLQGIWNAQDSGPYRVYNCGVAASDPFFEYILLRDKLLVLHPDLVLMSVNYSDVNDYITRGGMERFQPDGTTVFAKGPWFEPLYKWSHLVRLFVHFALRYDFSLLSPAAHRHKTEEAVEKIADCAATTQALCEQHGVRFMIVIHPYIDPYDRYLKKQEQLPALEGMLRMRNVAVVNLFDDFGRAVTEANYKTYSWPRDMHYTPKGYDLFAHFLAKEIKQQYPEYISVKEIKPGNR